MPSKYLEARGQGGHARGHAKQGGGQILLVRSQSDSNMIDPASRIQQAWY